MTELDLDERTNGHTDEVVEIDFDAILDSLSFGATDVPSDAEAVAIASAVSAHLTDRARAAAEAQADSAETVSQWTFSGRLNNVGASSRRRPRRVERGSEWQAAARSL